MIKFNTRFYDKVEGKYYELSAEFVKVPKHVEDRVNELMKDTRHENSFEYDKPTSVTDTVSEPKRTRPKK